jgi:hypothetical protein
MRTAPKQKKKTLLPLNIRRGRNLFSKSLISFDINSKYEIAYCDKLYNLREGYKFFGLILKQASV